MSLNKGASKIGGGLELYKLIFNKNSKILFNSWRDMVCLWYGE